MKARKSKFQAQLAKQLAIFLDNRPGMLARVCNALAAAKINILAISTSDTVDHTVIRIVVDDARKAIHLLEEHGTFVVDDEVLLIECENRPGVLASISHALAKVKINIEYCYCASSPSSERGSIVVRVTDPRKALRLLTR